MKHCKRNKENKKDVRDFAFSHIFFIQMFLFIDNYFVFITLSIISDVNMELHLKHIEEENGTKQNNFMSIFEES